MKEWVDANWWGIVWWVLVVIVLGGLAVSLAGLALALTQ